MFANKFWIPACLSFVLFVSQIAPSCASENEEIEIIRDAEIEDFLSEIVNQFLGMFQMDNERMGIFLIKDTSFNAFVVPGYAFVHSGLFMFSQNSDMLFGVLAHEVGHLINRHFYRSSLRQAQTLKETLFVGLATGLLGMGIPVAGLAGIGGIVGLLNATNFVFFKTRSFSRSDESEADNVATKILSQIGRSPIGLIDGMKYLDQIFDKDSKYVNEYFLSHPTPDKRVDAIEEKMNLDAESGNKIESGYDTKNPDILIIEDKYMRIRSKILGYFENHYAVSMNHKTTDMNPGLKKNLGFYNSYRNIQDLVRKEEWAKAKQDALKLLTQRPNDPYINEIIGDCSKMLGQNHLAKHYFGKSFAIIPKNKIIRYKFGLALLDLDNADLAQGISMLRALSFDEPDNPLVWEALSVGYKKQGQTLKSNHSKAMAAFHSKKCNVAKKLMKESQIYKDEIDQNIKIQEDFNIIKRSCRSQIL